MRVEATAPRQRGLLASGIDKAFGSHQVLNGANLSVEAGEVVGLLGANGAGKTTFISIATGALAADGGRVHLDGIDVATDRRAAARRLGTAPQELGVYPMLTVRENVIGMARVHGLSSRRARASSEEAIEALGLTACAGTRAEHLSGGQRRRLHTAMALAHQPAVVFLDEPTVGADIESRHQIVRHVRSLADAGAAVVYTTHYVHELEHLGARLAVLAGGRIQDHGPVQDAIDAWGGTRVRVRLDSRVGDHGTVPIPAAWERSGEWLVSTCADLPPGRALAAGLQQLGDLAADVVEVDVQRPSLEQAYLRILQHGQRPAGAEGVHAAP